MKRLIAEKENLGYNRFMSAESNILTPKHASGGPEPQPLPSNLLRPHLRMPAFAGMTISNSLGGAKSTRFCLSL
jgi:hypothetical protein